MLQWPPTLQLQLLKNWQSQTSKKGRSPYCAPVKLSNRKLLKITNNWRAKIEVVHYCYLGEQSRDLGATVPGPQLHPRAATAHGDWRVIWKGRMDGWESHLNMLPFVGLCLCSVTNWLIECLWLQSLIVGKTVPSVLNILRAVDSSSYVALIRDFESHSMCVGLLETGYFRKRSSSNDDVIAALLDSSDVFIWFNFRKNNKLDKE